MDKPILAICYDFDKTLSPDDMQAQGFIQSLGQEVEKFWNESNKLVLIFAFVIKINESVNTIAKSDFKNKMIPDISEYLNVIYAAIINNEAKIIIDIVKMSEVKLIG